MIYGFYLNFGQKNKGFVVLYLFIGEFLCKNYL